MAFFRSMVAIVAALAIPAFFVWPGMAQTPPPAKTKVVPAKGRLARLQLILPAGPLAGAEQILILKKKGFKVIKAFPPNKSTIHPLAPGRYMLMAKLKTCCSQKPAVAALGLVNLKPGRSLKLVMGGLGISLAPGLGGGLGKVHLFHQASSRPLVSMRVKSGRNLLPAIPLPPGAYTVAFEYAGLAKPMLAARDIKVEPGRLSRYSFNTAIALKGFGPELTGWDLVTHAGRKTALQVRGLNKGGGFPLGEAFPVQAGEYDILLYRAGKKTPAGKITGITIRPGRIQYQKAGL